MKILHTSDWHIGKRLYAFSRLPEQRLILDEICHIANDWQVDAVVIAGDIFDTFNPSTEAMQLFYGTVKRLSDNGRRAVIVIAGNHDSPDRIEAPEVLARECGILLIGNPNTKIQAFELETGMKVTKTDNGFCELQIPGCDTPLRLLLTPYANEYRLKTILDSENKEQQFRDILQNHWHKLAGKYCDKAGVNLLIAHVFMIPRGAELPEEPEDEKPILHAGGVQAIFTEAVPEQIHYTALGHLHRAFFTDGNKHKIRYSGTPLAYSFSEAGQKKSVSIVDFTSPESPVFTEIPLTNGKPLVRLSCNSVEEALTELSHYNDALIELTIFTENYISAEEKKSLENAHDGIVTIIPNIKTDISAGSGPHSIDLSQGIESLFESFFESRTGQKPNKELTTLFQEVIAKKS